MPDPYVSPWWQAVLLPERFTVAGVSVYPLTLWQVFALEQLGNPYLCGGKRSMDAAASLLMMASVDMDQGKRLMLGGKPLLRATRAIYRDLKGKSFAEVDGECAVYISDCLRAVDRFSKEGGSVHPSAVPYIWHMVRCLCDNYGCSIGDAWNTPYSLARCYYDTVAESNGDKSLASDTAQRLIDERNG